MNDITLLYTAIVHAVYGRIARGRLGARSIGGARRSPDSDRGDVSLSQVLWFVAAGVGVAVIAGIVWSRIRAEANRPIVTPTAP